MSQGMEIDEAPATQTCWLCQHCMSQTYEVIKDFVTSTCMDMDLKELCLSVQSIVREAEGREISEREVEMHLRRHMLHPALKLAIHMRDMSGIYEQIRDSVSPEDEKGVKLLISASHSVVNICKLGDHRKLTFGAREKGKDSTANPSDPQR